MAAHATPNLPVITLEISKRMENATKKDMKIVKHIFEKIRLSPSSMNFLMVGEKDSFEVGGIGDASYKTDNEKVHVVLLGMEQR